MASKVSARGRITIDRAARRVLGIKSGMAAVQIVVDDHLEVYFLPPRHRRSLFGVLPPQAASPSSDWQALDEEAGRSIAQEAF
ncbi:MAG: AbrB/MazE/SpoVT family DNA-binding domain-containing protein [Chloroflexi bacterium]|nr:AbrB/MazE/SpoVT family DNA-binding domain-containing protein [Chloroflexota bacterium]